MYDVDKIMKISGPNAAVSVREACRSAGISLRHFFLSSKIERNIFYRWRDGAKPQLETVLRFIKAFEKLNIKSPF